MNRKIMILDDNILDVMEVEGHLKRAGYEVVHLSSPNGALSKIEYEHPHALLLEIGMPRLNVDDLLQRLLSSHDYDNLVIILYSGMDVSQLRKICVDNQINGYFSKTKESRDIPGFLEAFFDALDESD